MIYSEEGYQIVKYDASYLALEKIKKTDKNSTNINNW
jgi:hypothetical protein